MARAGTKPARRRVTGGVDTHGATHHAAVQLMNGGRVADAEFPATSTGYALLLDWMRSFGRLHAIGVEGTGSYGAGLARYLAGQGITVIEVNRPDRAQRRSRGKSDPLDAYAAADAVLAGRATALPKGGDGPAESIRVLHATRAGAVKARTAALNELRSLLITAPAGLRESLQGLGPARLTTACARMRPARDAAAPATAVRLALRSLARRHQALTAEIAALDACLAPLVAAAGPALLALRGVGPETAAQLLVTAGDNPHRLRSAAAFAALCGTAPLPASSGKTTRHRLSRGGDRQANRALYIIAISRMATCPRTRAYVDRRTTEGRSKKEIIRCLKRYIAREIYNNLTRPSPPPQPLDNP
jgi:transposase